MARISEDAERRQSLNCRLYFVSEPSRPPLSDYVQVYRLPHGVGIGERVETSTNLRCIRVNF